MSSSWKEVISLVSSSESDSEKDLKGEKKANVSDTSKLTGKRKFVFNNESVSGLHKIENLTTFTPNEEIGCASKRSKRFSSESENVHKCMRQPFYLTTVPVLSDTTYNRNCLSFSDLLYAQDDNPLISVLLMNYMMDLEWIFAEAPQLLSCPTVLCLHGSSVDSSIQFDNLRVAKVDLGAERFGTHHSKIAILRYQSGLRVVVTTANFIPEDFTYRTQGVFVQDFPLSSTDVDSGKVQSQFEKDLTSYLQHIRTDSKTTRLLHDEIIVQLASYDFSSARAILIPSIPGRHFGEHRSRWGLGKLIHELHRADCLSSHREDGRQPADASTRLCMQFSSLGSMGKDAKLVYEYARRMLFASHCGGISVDKLARMTDVVWPTLSTVQASFQGYVSGGSLPCNMKSMYDASKVAHSKHLKLSNIQEGLRRTLRRWDGGISGRNRATPHMKCYFKYRVFANDVEGDHAKHGPIVEIDWFLLTSSNLSQAAWGIYQSNDQQLYIKSYEMGVLLLPENELQHPENQFSCTPLHPILGIRASSQQEPHISRLHHHHHHSQSSHDAPQSHEKVCFVPLNFSNPAPTAQNHIPIPIPFSIPPQSYDERVDQPWVWDVPFPQFDCLGQPRISSMDSN